MVSVQLKELFAQFYSYWRIPENVKSLKSLGLFKTFFDNYESISIMGILWPFQNGKYTAFAYLVYHVIFLVKSVLENNP